MMADAGVPYIAILGSYEVLTESQDQVVVGGDSRHRLRNLEATLDLLQHWATSAQSSGLAASNDVETALSELRRATASGRLRPKIEALKGKLEASSGTANLLDRLSSIEEAFQYMSQ